MSSATDSFSGKNRKPFSLPFILFVAALAAFAVYFFVFRTEGNAQQDEPLLAEISLGDIENTVAAAGSLQPYEFVDVGAQVSGQLQKLYVDVGDYVEAGQLLAEIDARVQEARVDASRASIEALEAQIEARRASLVLAEANAERQERLMAADATSQLDYDNAINNLASAKANLVQLEKQILQSRASLNSDETQLEFSKIYAPTSGTVVSVEMNEGRTLNAVQMAPTILRIANLKTMTVEAEISEADIGRIKEGMQVYFTTLGSGDRRWYSTLRQILPTPVIENNVVLYTGLFDIENTDGILLPEMTAQVYFVTAAARNVLTVPMGALTFLDTPGTADSANAPAAPRPSPEQMRERLAAMGGPPPGFDPQAAGFPPGGGIPGGGFPGGGNVGAPGANGANAPGLPRPAKVTVVEADGSRREQLVLIGVSSRISAEVIDGLKAGDQVIAGIIQRNLPVATNTNGPPGGFPPPF